MKNRPLGLCAVFLLTLTALGCGSELLGLSASDSTDELGQQLGDIMASIDEMGGSSSGSYPLLMRPHARLEREFDFRSSLDQLLISSSQAATCQVGSSYSGCSGNTITRTFNGCTYGSIRASGTVTLTWGGGAALCIGAGAGSTITRSPNFTLANRRGATLSIQKSGSYGQRITDLGSSNYRFESDGIRRTYTNSSNNTTLDFSTETTAAMNISGGARSGRVLGGGTIKVTNHLSGVFCSISPTSVTWGNNCNCATSGSFSGNCSDGKTLSANVIGCGSLRLTFDNETYDVDLDRCFGI